MKTKTKIWLILYILSLVGTGLLIPYLIPAISFVGGLQIQFSSTVIVAICFAVFNMISFFALLFVGLNALSLPNKLFALTMPLTAMLIVFSYIVLGANGSTAPIIIRVRTALNVETSVTNTWLWLLVATVFYLACLLVIYSVVCRPVREVQKYAERLSNGYIKDSIEIKGGAPFSQIGHNLNKINENFLDKENLIRKTNLEYEKYIPKQFLKFLGKSSILELELGNQVQKEVTTLFCDIRNSTGISTTMSLEENFETINAYLNQIVPIVRKKGGFIDKYMGDGVLAVFPAPEKAYECAISISKALDQQKTKVSLDATVSIHTGDVILGVVGDEMRKSLTVISDAVNFAGKMEKFVKELGAKIIFSKSTLNNLPASYPMSYRYIGSLSVDKVGDKISVFESLETYSKQNRERLEKNKIKFEEGVRCFDNANFEKAKDIFKEVYRAEKQDKVCYLYYNKSIENIGGKAPYRV